MVQHNLYYNYLVPHPIGRLPIETLEQIFIECARNAYHPNTVFTSEEDDHDASPRWVEITWVCRLWCRISLACPHLWIQTTTHPSHRRVQELLKRSRNYPLVLELSTVHSRFSDITAVISANAFRIKELYLGDVGANNRKLRRVLDGRLTASAPLLENFVLDTDLYEIRDDMFSGHAPRLRRLWLGDSMSVSVTYSLLGSLRELRLRETYNTDYLLDLLQRTPLLESLKVRRLNPGDQYSGDKIRLPHLSRLHIRFSEYRQFVDFFEPLQIPPTVHFQLTLRKSGTEEEYAAVLNVIPDRLRGIGKSAGPLYAKIELKPEKGWSIAWYPMIETLDDPTGDRRPRRALLEHDGAMMNDVQCMVDRLSPLTDVHALQLTLTLPSDPVVVKRLSEEGSLQYPNFKTWAPILSAMSNVRILKLACDAIAGVLMALTSDDSVRETPLLPKLSKLVIVKSGLPDLRSNDYPPRLNIGGVLEAFLSKRLEHGLRVEHLSINDDVGCDMEHM
ncbi:hypothetical protein HETIRDRAFT_104892 [Heterobasidion irregulare TC 32-1]|uniref:F-box domain-containing protein n=1 Tax=Heterobasidion irregulare (strain TC 32-1) TaxID=747525 RepID=W4K6Y1_HETIT|nr:uncharacterized protein HETIRDRAFT_104892 [Heterobasidion irregulare TC 32-1]ETW81568.1 hypothetical protein HETIRDRAFT_104892 [Heterobasidion irregulare TC 32-1]